MRIHLISDLHGAAAGGRGSVGGLAGGGDDEVAAVCASLATGAAQGLRESGLRVPEWRALAALYARKHSTMSELADLATIDRTIAQLNGAGTMDDKDLYHGFAPEKQAEYEEWLRTQPKDLPKR